MKQQRHIGVNVKDRYHRAIQAAMVVALLICIVILQAFKRFESRPEPLALRIEAINTIEIPQTVQEKLLPPPVRPAVPIESDSDEIPDDITIGESELRFDEMPAPPEPQAEDDPFSFPFVAYDEPPQPLGGFAAIQKNMIYPELARRAGIEGMVVVWAKISETGEVVDTRIVIPLDNSGCNEAAVAAIKSVRWIPARQRDVPVAVWISIPIHFKLK